MEILKLKNKNQKEIFEKTIKILKEEKVVICPTDTVYGLIALATSKKATERIFEIKKRDIKKPIPIFVKNINFAKKIAKITPQNEKFLKMVWPGKVTAILKRKKSQIKIYGIEREKIALRIPKYKFLNKLLETLNLPLTATSANISKTTSFTKIKDLLKQIKSQKEKPDLVIDAGDLPKSKPSVILDLTETPFRILRF